MAPLHLPHPYQGTFLLSTEKNQVLGLKNDQIMDVLPSFVKFSKQQLYCQISQNLTGYLAIFGHEGSIVHQNEYQNRKLD
jgi:hypothetical protein